MSNLKEYWVTKTYRSFNDLEFVFFMGFSCISTELALRESLGKTEYEDLQINIITEDHWIATENMETGNISTFEVEQRTGPPTPPSHKNWSIYDSRLDMHLPKWKEIPAKLF